CPTAAPRSPADPVGRDRVSGPPGLPVVERDVPADVPIAETLDLGDHPWVVGAGPERAAEPWMRVDAGCVLDRCGAVVQVVVDASAEQERHPRVVMRMVSDQVPVG